MKRFYYKDKLGNFYDLKEKYALDDLDLKEITKEEFDEHAAQVEAELLAAAKAWKAAHQQQEEIIEDQPAV